MSIGGYLTNGTKESNLTVDNYMGRVGIGTTTPTSKLEVIGTITASSIVRSGGTSSQYLMADGSTSSLLSSNTNSANMTFSIFNDDRTFNSIKAGRGMIISYDDPQNILTFDIATTLPINELTALGLSLRLKSNTIMFDDDSNDPMMAVGTLYVAIYKQLDMWDNNIVNVTNITATGAISTTGSISSNSLTTNTLTTSGTSLNIKSDIVRFRGLDDTVYIEADTGGVKFYDGVFMNSYLQIQNGLSLGSLTGGTWTDKMAVSGSTGNISTNGTITAVGNITGVSWLIQLYSMQRNNWTTNYTNCCWCPFRS